MICQKLPILAILRILKLLKSPWPPWPWRLCTTLLLYYFQFLFHNLSLLLLLQVGPENIWSGFYRLQALPVTHTQTHV